MVLNGECSFMRIPAKWFSLAFVFTKRNRFPSAQYHLESLEELQDFLSTPYSCAWGAKKLKRHYCACCIGSKKQKCANMWAIFMSGKLLISFWTMHHCIGHHLVIQCPVLSNISLGYTTAEGLHKTGQCKTLIHTIFAWQLQSLLV